MRELTVTLPDEIAERVRRKVDSGEYPNESEVILVALEALDNDPAPMRRPEIEHAVRSEVVPTYEAVEADPSQVLEEVKSSLVALLEQTSKARGGG